MLLFTQLVGPADPRPATLQLSLTHEQRRKARLRVVLPDGSEVGLDLPRGLALKHGQRLANDDATELAVVVAAPEDVSRARTEDSLLLARAAYHLGNRHVPLQVEPGVLTYLRDHVLDDLARELGLVVEHAVSPFEPEAGGHSREHGHRHDTRLAPPGSLLRHG